MLVLRSLLLLLVLGSTTACIGPLRSLEPLAPEPVCQSRMVEVPTTAADGTTTTASHAVSECSVSVLR